MPRGWGSAAPVGLLVLASCVGEGATTTTAPPATTEATTTTSATTTTLVFRVETPGLGPPAPFTGSEGASGSGCPAGGGPPDDGVWFGYVLAASTTSVTFSPGCLYFGDIAWEKAAEQGEEAPNDVWIERGDGTIEVAVAEDAVAYAIIAPGQSDLQVRTMPYREWPPRHPQAYTPCPGEFCSVWLYVNGGVATELTEQYLP